MNPLLDNSQKPFPVPTGQVTEQQSLAEILATVPPEGGDTLRSMIRDMTSRAFYGESVHQHSQKIADAIIAITGCGGEEVDEIFEDLISQV